MKKGVFFLVFFMIFAKAKAEDISLIREAEAYFEAHDYAKARELYRLLERENLHGWQKQRIIYNIGTTYLEEGDWEKAREEYSRIDEFREHSQYIAWALYTNEAVLCYRQGMDILHHSNPLKANDYGKAIYLFRNAIQKIKEAKEAECRFAAFIGEPHCESSEDLEMLLYTVKGELAITLKKYEEAIIEEATLRESVPFLLEGVRNALSHLVFLESKQLDENLKKQYLALFINDVESWLTLWDAKINHFEDLEQAYTAYLKGIKEMKANQFAESRIAFLDSEVSLSQLIQKLWGADPLIKLLQILAAAYDRAFTQIPVQTATLHQVKLEQEQVEKAAHEDGQEFLQKANFFLSQSQNLARQSKDTAARIYLEEARQWIRRLILLKINRLTTPETVLEDAIEEQTHALSLRRLAQNSDLEEKETLLDSQKMAVQSSTSFFSAVMEQEEKEYPQRCQCTPWDEVIPLFEKGRRAAERALINTEASLVMKEQEKAIFYWKEALEKLKNPKASPVSKKTQSFSQENTMEQIVNQIQQMHQDDRLPQLEMRPKEGLRPW